MVWINSKMFRRTPQNFLKAGGVIATIGTIMIIIFGISLIGFPVSKQCEKGLDECRFVFSVPYPFQSILRPEFLVLALSLTALGVALIRFTKYMENRKYRESNRI